MMMMEPKPKDFTAGSLFLWSAQVLAVNRRSSTMSPSVNASILRFLSLVVLSSRSSCFFLTTRRYSNVGRWPADVSTTSSSSLFQSDDDSDSNKASSPPPSPVDDKDDEWHPRDPAHTTPQLLSGIWHQISEAGSMAKGETYTVIYPQMQDKLNTPRFLNAVLGHLDVCKDVCDHYGISTTLVPHQQADSTVVGFTAKSFRDPGGSDTTDGTLEFAYDPFWDDGTDFDNLYEGIDDEYETANPRPKEKYPEIEDPVPDDDEQLVTVTKAWVAKMMSDMGICPFTQGADKAGLPLGDVFYCVDRSTGVEDMYAKYWKEVVRVEQNKERDLSTTLLIAPNFFLGNVEMFENFSNTLTQALTTLQVEELLQLVFFHPQWCFRDGGDRSGAGEAANYARRSPWPMINLLRTNQVRTAQKGIPTGLVYKQNEKTLSSIGVPKLETMLRLRDWGDISDLKVNRREMDALKIAQDFQSTGTLNKEDISLEHDSTPAANKVDRRQVEQGDLVTVLVQALDKRLGKSSSSAIAPLTGPETSASAMAADFLIQELDKMIATSVATADLEIMTETGKSESGASLGPQEAARLARLEAARKALLADFVGESNSPSDRGDEMTDVLFGKGGIPDRPDEQFNKGLDPGSFY